MKAILTIGYTRLLLPLDEATKVMKVLGRALLVRRSFDEGVKEIMIESEELGLEIEVVKAKTRIVTEDGEDASESHQVKRPKKPTPNGARLTNGNEILRLT